MQDNAVTVELPQGEMLLLKVQRQQRQYETAAGPKLQRLSITEPPDPNRSAGPDTSLTFLVGGQWSFLYTAELDLVIHSLLNIHMEG